MNWKQGFAVLAVSLAGLGMVSTPMDADAKRLGGGRPAGMQRQAPPRQPSATPNQPPQQAPNQNNAAQPGGMANQPGAVQPGKRSWLGPVAGIAAGLGIAALMSHFGMGEAMGNVLTMILLAGLAFMAITWLMRRMRGAHQAPGGGQLAGAGAPYSSPNSAPSSGQQQPMWRDAAPAQPAAAVPASSGVGDLSHTPAGFDAAGFQRVAKMIFIRLQAANDAGNLDDLRKFTTPELFASLRLDLQDRGQAPNQTDVMQLDAELVDTAKEDGQWIASVRFHGLIREEVGAGAHPFNELWHLVRPIDESRDWAIAGITPLDA